MNKLFAVMLLALTVSVPSFGAEHLVTRSAKDASSRELQGREIVGEGNGQGGESDGKVRFLR